MLVDDAGRRQPVRWAMVPEAPFAPLGEGPHTDDALSVEFQTHGLPMTLFFDDRGNHVHSHIGELSEVELFNYVIDLKAGNLNPI